MRKGNWQLIGKITYFIVGVLAIFALNTFFTGDFLAGKLKANDAAFNLHVIEWLDRWFPRFPQWYPLQGGGMSLVRGYPVFAHLVTIFISKITFLDLNQAMRLVNFSNLFMVALGIYAFVWVKLKNQTIALIAGSFYFLSAASSQWLMAIGLYSQAFSIIFVPWVFLSFDSYLLKVFKDEHDGTRRLWFFLTVLALALAALSHFVTFAVMTEAIFLYGFIYALFFPKEGFSLSSRLTNIWRSGTAAVVIIFLSLFLASFLLLPFLDYRQVAGRGNLLLPAVEQVRSLPPLVLLGLKEAASYQEEYIEAYSFSIPVWILAIIGLAFAAWKKNIFILTLGVLSFLIAFQMNLPRMWPGIIKTFLFFFGTVHVRAVISLIILIPILAGFGVWSLAEAGFFPILRFFKRGIILKEVFCPLLALVISVYTIFIIFRGQVPRNASGLYQDKYQQLVSGDLSPWRFIPPSQISQSRLLAMGIPDVETLAKKLNLDNKTRLDISTNLHFGIQAWPLYSDASIAMAYEGYSVVNKAMNGYETAVYYGKTDIQNPSQVINELARWFGINYVFLNKSKDPLERYDNNWQNIEETSAIMVKKFKDDIPLVSWSSKPTILVLGSFDKGAFEQVFRAANAGGISYDQALLVESKDSGNINDYNLKELKNFDIVFLYGYTYNDKNKAWTLLDQYVKEGGNLFIETGWQYVNPDWKQDLTPEFLPLKRLEWKTFGTRWDLVLDKSDITGDIDLSQFAEPVWKSDPWGVSTENKANLRPWANSVLSIRDNPLLAAGEYGKGKIVWSGMNLLGHAFTYQNQEEYRLLSNLIEFLKGSTSATQLPIKFSRDYPDRVEFSLPQSTGETTSLYWRESYLPNWRATLVTDNLEEKTYNLDIYKAGPEYILMRIPPTGGTTKIILQFDYRLVNFARLVSLFTFIFLMIYLFKPKILSSPITYVRYFFRRRWEKEEG